jgi:catenin alpha
MRALKEEDKEKISAEVEHFRTEKMKFDQEVAKWDDAGNDIIVLAKHMCMIMMEMTDFTRFVPENTIACKMKGFSKSLY